MTTCFAGLFTKSKRPCLVYQDITKTIGCTPIVKVNKLALVWKEDELSRLAADTTAHAQAVDEATTELADVASAADELQKHQGVLATQQADDTQALTKRQQDHALLAKVVAQAVTVLKEAGAPVAEAATVLDQAGTLLVKQADADKKTQDRKSVV